MARDRIEAAQLAEKMLAIRQPEAEHREPAYNLVSAAEKQPKPTETPAGRPSISEEAIAQIVNKHAEAFMDAISRINSELESLKKEVGQIKSHLNLEPQQALTAFQKEQHPHGHYTSHDVEKMMYGGKKPNS